MKFEKKFQYKKQLSIVLVFSLFISPILPFSNDLKINFASAASTLPPYSSTIDESLLSSSGSSNNTGVAQMEDFSKYGTKVLGCNNSAGLFRKSLSDLNTANPDLSTEDDSAITGSSNTGGVPSFGVGYSSDYLLNKYGNQDADFSSTSGLLADGSSAGSQAVSDEGVIKSLKQLNENEKKIMENAANQKVWEQCLNGIAVKISQKQIASMSQGILNWVNTGFNGDPLFVRDPESFFKKIQDDSLQSFIAPFTNPTNSSVYPYGKSTSQMLVNNANNTFANIAKSTLQDSLPEGVTTEDFSNDFSKGGWTGWLSLTQNPANNPLGFAMIASEEASKQSEANVQAKKDELAQGKGFLSATKCVEYRIPEGTEGQDSTYRETGSSLSSGDPNCIRTEIVTPGSIIADQASAVLTSPIRQLELAKTVNDSLDQVFNSLVNQLTTKGLSSLDSYAGGSITTGDVPSLNMVSKSYYDTYSNLIKVNTGYGGWNTYANDFDITRDLGDIYTPAFEYKIVTDPTSILPGGTKTIKIPVLDARGKQIKTIAKKGIISIQKDYITAATESVKTLDPILPAIGELDYCIPGPNPSWETRTMNRIYDLQNYLGNMDFGGVQRVSIPRWIKSDANLSIAASAAAGLGAALAPATAGISVGVAVVFGVIVSVIKGNHDRANAADAARMQEWNYYSKFYFDTNQSHLINSFTWRFNLYQNYIAQRYTQVFGGIGGGSNAICNDGIDNDGDGKVDTNDAGCHSDGNPTNTNSWNKKGLNETNVPPICGDGISDEGKTVPNTTNGNGFSSRIADNQNPTCYPNLSAPVYIAVTQRKYVVLNGTNGLTVPSSDPRYILGQGYPSSGLQLRTLEPSIDGYDRYFPGGQMQCSNLTDDDGDNLKDIQDPSCHTDGDPTNSSTYNKYAIENNTTECNDNVDNDSDGTKDIGDNGCHSDLDASNTNSYLPFKTSEIHLNSGAKLPMAAEGMNITKNIENYDANIAQAKKDYQTQVTEVKNNIVKLNSIKAEVDKIMKDAQDRRTAKINGMKNDAIRNDTQVNFCPGVDPNPDVIGEVDINGGTGGTVQ